MLWLCCACCCGCRCSCHKGHGRFEGTHGSVLKVVAPSLSISPFLLVSLSLFLRSCVSLLSHVSLFLSLSAHLSFSFFLFSLSNSVNNNDNDRSSSWLSLYTAMTCPECRTAWPLAHSLSGEHVRIMQGTIVQVFLCMPRATCNEVGLYLKRKNNVRGVVCLCCVCLCVLLRDVVCCHCCRRCAVGGVSVGVDALACVVRK